MSKYLFEQHFFHTHLLCNFTNSPQRCSSPITGGQRSERQRSWWVISPLSGSKWNRMCGNRKILSVVKCYKATILKCWCSAQQEELISPNHTHRLLIKATAARCYNTVTGLSCEPPSHTGNTLDPPCLLSNSNASLCCSRGTSKRGFCSPPVGGDVWTSVGVWGALPLWEAARPLSHGYIWSPLGRCWRRLRVEQPQKALFSLESSWSNRKANSSQSINWSNNLTLQCSRQEEGKCLQMMGSNCSTCLLSDFVFL